MMLPGNQRSCAMPLLLSAMPDHCTAGRPDSLHSGQAGLTAQRAGRTHCTAGRPDMASTMKSLLNLHFQLVRLLEFLGRGNS